MYIRKRGHCQLAGLDNVQCGGGLQCAHIATRGVHHLAFTTRNALCLCAGHHRYYTTRSHEWFMDVIPRLFPEQYKYVMANMYKAVPFKRQDYIDTIARLEHLLQQ